MSTAAIEGHLNWAWKFDDKNRKIDWCQGLGHIRDWIESFPDNWPYPPPFRYGLCHMFTLEYAIRSDMLNMSEFKKHITEPIKENNNVLTSDIAMRWLKDCVYKTFPYVIDEDQAQRGDIVLCYTHHGLFRNRREMNHSVIVTGNTAESKYGMSMETVGLSSSHDGLAFVPVSTLKKSKLTGTNKKFKLEFRRHKKQETT